MVRKMRAQDIRPFIHRVWDGEKCRQVVGVVRRDHSRRVQIVTEDHHIFARRYDEEMVISERCDEDSTSNGDPHAAGSSDSGSTTA